MGLLAAVFAASFFSYRCAHPAGRIPLQSTDYVEEGEEPLTWARVALYRDFLVRNPDVDLIPFRPLNLPPAISPHRRSRLLFAMLGDAGPDHLVTSAEDFEVLHEQHFLYPLDEYTFDVLRDKSGRPVDPDGHRLDPTESGLFYRDSQTGKYGVAVSINRRVSISPEWDNLPALLRVTAIREGKVFGMPVLKGRTCLIYRKDLFREAGLDPESPPTDWDAFVYCAQKLTDPEKPIRGAPVQKGQRGFACGIDPALEWLNYLWQAGGDALHKVRVCSAGHTVATKKEAESPAKCSVCERSLLDIRQSWAPSFDSNAGVVALRYYTRLRRASWTRCSRCYEPVPVPSKTDNPPVLVCNGPKGCGQRFPYPPADMIYRGVVRELGTTGGVDRLNLLAELFERGEVAIAVVNQPYRFIASLSLPDQSIGMMAPPAGWQWVECPYCRDPIVLTGEAKKSGRAVCPRDSAYMDLAGAEVRGGLSASLFEVELWGTNASSPKVNRDAVWRLIVHRVSGQGTIAMAQSLVEADYARAVPPSHLLLAGQRHLYDALPKSWILVEQQYVSSGRLVPWVPGWSDFMSSGLQRLLQDAVRDGEAGFRTAINEAATKCARVICTRDLAVVRKQGKGVSGILIPLALLVLLGVWRLYRALPKRKTSCPAPAIAAGKRNVVPWLLLTPALALLLVWVCLPLLRGAHMSFYDWQVGGEKRFLGTANFGEILASPEFWRILFQTILFVGLTLVLGFAAPFLLALALNEVPRGRSLFRMVFYFPALSTGLAVALLWKLMYEPTETGFLNWLLLHMPRPTYLILPILLMVALAGFSALFFRRREFIPGTVLLVLTVGLVLLIPRIEPLKRPVNWLGNPASGGIWTMICVIVPAAWASAGPGSLLYLAALRAIPEELYESAELEGAGVFAKMRYIVLAELRPLLTINLIGAIAGTSQAIRNLFVMTGGGPDGKTRVLALDFWYNAFAYLRFGYATALAWILASMVIGLGVCQLRRLYLSQFCSLRVETSFSGEGGTDVPRS